MDSLQVSLPSCSFGEKLYGSWHFKECRMGVSVVGSSCFDMWNCTLILCLSSVQDMFLGLYYRLWRHTSQVRPTRTLFMSPHTSSNLLWSVHSKCTYERSRQAKASRISRLRSSNTYTSLSCCTGTWDRSANKRCMHIAERRYPPHPRYLRHTRRAWGWQCHSGATLVVRGADTHAYPSCERTYSTPAAPVELQGADPSRTRPRIRRSHARRTGPGWQRLGRIHNANERG